MVLRKEIWSLPRILWHFQVLFGLGELVVLGGVIEKLGPCQNTVRTDFATKIGFPSSKWLPYLPSLTWFRHAPSNNLYSIQSLLILPMGGDISKLFDFFLLEDHFRFVGPDHRESEWMIISQQMRPWNGGPFSSNIPQPLDYIYLLDPFGGKSVTHDRKTDSIHLPSSKPIYPLPFVPTDLCCYKHFSCSQWSGQRNETYLRAITTKNKKHVIARVVLGVCPSTQPESKNISIPKGIS